MSFAKRQINITFKLGSGTFNGSDNDTILISGKAVSAQIVQRGLGEADTCYLRIYGLSKQQTDRMTQMSWQPLANNQEYQRNQVSVSVGTNNDDLVNLFVGDIYQSYPDYVSAPNIAFIVECRSGYIASLAKVGAENYPGVVPVETMAASIAKQMGATLDNQGVTGTLTDQYLSNTAVEKLRKLAYAASFDWYFKPPILTIVPKRTPINVSESAPIVSIDTGLVGWPQLDVRGVRFKTLFNPALLHGSQFFMHSNLPYATGQYYAAVLTHHLECQIPGGAWFTDVFGSIVPNSPAIK
jgi:hypothetical protein